MSQSLRFVVQSAARLCCKNHICHVFDERVTLLLSLNLTCLSGSVPGSIRAIWRFWQQITVSTFKNVNLCVCTEPNYLRHKLSRSHTDFKPDYFMMIFLVV